MQKDGSGLISLAEGNENGSSIGPLSFSQGEKFIYHLFFLQVIIGVSLLIVSLHP